MLKYKKRQYRPFYTINLEAKASFTFVYNVYRKEHVAGEWASRKYISSGGVFSTIYPIRHLESKIFRRHVKWLSKGQIIMQ